MTGLFYNGKSFKELTWFNQIELLCRLEFAARALGYSPMEHLSNSNKTNSMNENKYSEEKGRPSPSGGINSPVTNSPGLSQSAITFSQKVGAAIDGKRRNAYDQAESVTICSGSILEISQRNEFSKHKELEALLIELAIDLALF